MVKQDSFDQSSYRKDEIILVEPRFDCPIESDGDKWYNACCNLTLSEESAGIIAGRGVVSSSEFGDGFYPLFQIKNEQGKVVALKVEFIVEEENDEYYQCDNCDTEYEFEEGDGNFCSSDCREEYNRSEEEDEE